jgi:hypothetical protein
MSGEAAMLHPPDLLLPNSPARLLELPDDELVAQVWAAWLTHLANVKGIDPADITMEMALSIVQPTLEMDTDSIAMAGPEKLLKAVAGGKVATARRMLQDLLEEGARSHKLRSECAANRRRQSERAKKPREDELDEAIREVVEKRGIDISERDLRGELDQMAQDGHKRLEDVTDDYIYVTPRKGDPTKTKRIKTAALSYRLSRIKRKIRKLHLP